MSANPPETELQLENGPPITKKWDYETFKEYLLSQARGRDFLLPIEEFPEHIELSDDWHGVLNAMRAKTKKDKIERVALTGHNLQQRALYLPTERVVEVPWQWERDAPVSRQAIEVQRAFAKTQGADGFVGILHSHPPKDIPVLERIIKNGRLSAGDLHIALTGFYGSMIGVADGKINSFAFKTRSSVVPSEGQDYFYDLWEGKPQPKKVDELISQKYNLALYKGGVNSVLKRVYPKS